MVDIFFSTVLNGIAYGVTFGFGLHYHAGAWERGSDEIPLDPLFGKGGGWCVEQRVSLLALFHGALLVAFPVALFQGCAFVVQFLAFGDADFEFCLAIFPVHGGSDQGVAFAFDETDEFVQFMAVQQQFARAPWLRMDVRGGAQQRVDGAAEDEGFTIFDGDVALLDVEMPGSQRLDFPALQHDAGFVALFDKIIVSRFFIQRDGAAG